MYHHNVPLQQLSCRVTALDLVNFSIFNFVNTSPLTPVGCSLNVTGVISTWPRCTHHVPRQQFSCRVTALDLVNFSIYNFVNTSPLTPVGCSLNVTGVISTWPRCTHHYVPHQQFSCRVTALDLVNFSIYNFVNTSPLTPVGCSLNVTGVISTWPRCTHQYVPLQQLSCRVTALDLVNFSIFNFVNTTVGFPSNVTGVISAWPICTHHHYVPLQQLSCRVTALDLVNFSIFNYVNTTPLTLTPVGFSSNVTVVISAGLDVHIIIMIHYNNCLAELLPLTW